eukprot:6205152-Amphidinium_carterae.2
MPMLQQTHHPPQTPFKYTDTSKIYCHHKGPKRLPMETHLDVANAIMKKLMHASRAGNTSIAEALQD